MKSVKPKYLIEITKLSGEVILARDFPSELAAHNHFEEMEKIRHPNTFKFEFGDISMNLSEYPENRVGSVRVVVENHFGRFVRRELYRKA